MTCTLYDADGGHSLESDAQLGGGGAGRREAGREFGLHRCSDDRGGYIDCSGDDHRAGLDCDGDKRGVDASDSGDTLLQV